MLSSLARVAAAVLVTASVLLKSAGAFSGASIPALYILRKFVWDALVNLRPGMTAQVEILVE
ncbi:MAG: hypothetical protein SXV54_17480 [Chloroflexota bacterium]|nr:hypothetical protein [Chloroflexota bacterium]